MRKLCLTALLLFAAFAAAQTPLVPTTTLSVEIGNNTSASDQISALTKGHAPSANVSKVPMRSLLYSGSTTKLYGAIMGWFGKSSHINVGYNSQDPMQAAKQIADMKSRGLDGAILAWYGKDSYENKTGLALKAAAEANAPFEFSIMIDRGTLDWDSMGLAPTDALIVHLNYLADNYYGSTAYTRINGRPVVYEFALEAYTIDWARVRASIKGNPMIIFRNPNGWTRPTSDGGYAWEPDKDTTSYLDYFYKTALNYPTLQTLGGVSPSFNDTLAAWTQNRIVDPKCGQTWLMKWADQSKWYSSAKPLNQIQVATWNDYEEGSTIESGIDNCINVNAAVNGNALSWTLSGTGLENTIDHYTVYISADGQNLMPLADVPTGTYSYDLSGYQFMAGNYSLFVKAVAKPSVTNKMSNAATFVSTFVPNKPPVAQLTLSTSSLYTPSTVSASTLASTDADGSIASSTINWGDGNTSSGPSASHVYANAGIYTVTATVTDDDGATAQTSSDVNVQPATVLITSPSAGATTNSTVHVEATAFNGNVIDGMWLYVDNKAAFNAKGSELVADISVPPGLHTYQVKAWDIYGTITQSSVDASVVNLPPVAKLSLSALSAPSGSSITADSSTSNDVDGTITATVIDFGDGTVASASSSSHAYALPGTYVVTATVTDNSGAASSASATVVVTNRPPTAKLALSATSVYSGTVITASAGGSSDPDGTIATSVIDFGDGTIANGASAVHAYAKPGTYTVRATVNDNLGASATTSASVNVLNQAPIAKIALSSASIYAGQAVTVSSSGSSDADGGIATMRIDFGDGSSSNSASATHIYPTAGTYTVTVTVTDNNGATTTSSATLTVKYVGVTILKPTPNSSSTSSVNVVATAASPRPIASMIIYVDNVRMYTIYASSLNTTLSLRSGTHTILVKSWEDVTGTVYQSSVVMNVK